MKIKTDDIGFISFNDGVMFFGEIKTLLNATKKKIGEEFTQKGKLFFKELSARESDVITANNQGYRIDKKIQTYFRQEVSRKNKVKINNELFDIKSLDSDKEFMYIYLQKVGD